jgi:hypothetical protein
LRLTAAAIRSVELGRMPAFQMVLLLEFSENLVSVISYPAESVAISTGCDFGRPSARAVQRVATLQNHHNTKVSSAGSFVLTAVRRF